MTEHEANRTAQPQDPRLRQVDPRTAEAELKLRFEEIKKAVSRLEEAKAVSQETLQLEVSV